MGNFRREVLNISFLTLILIFININLASAGNITPSDLDLDNPSGIWNEYTNNISSQVYNFNHGSLEVTLYGSTTSTDYIYTLLLDPDNSHSISSFAISGINDFNNAAGYDFDQASTAITPASPPLQEEELIDTSFDYFNDTLLFVPSSTWKTAGDNMVTFFFQTTSPTDINSMHYTIVNGGITNLPVPEPGTMMLLLTGLGCVTGMKFKNMFRSKNRAN